MATYYVDCNMPDDSENGLSWETAKKYVSSGINLLNSGDTLYIAKGEYTTQYDYISLTNSKFANCTIIGQGMDSTIIRRGGSGSTFSCSNSSITNLLVKDLYFASVGQIAVNITSGQVTFERVAIDSNYYMLDISSVGITFKQCLIKIPNNYWSRIYGSGTHNFYSCIFAAPDDAPIGGRAIFSTSTFTGTVNLYNCVFVNVSRAYYADPSATGTVNFYNCICTNNTFSVSALFTNSGGNAVINVYNSVLLNRDANIGTINASQNNKTSLSNYPFLRKRYVFIVPRVDDDTNINYAKSVEELLASYGCRGVYSFQTMSLDTGRDELIRMLQRGTMEIASHSVTHDNVTQTGTLFSITTSGRTINIDKTNDVIVVDNTYTLSGFKSLTLTEIKNWLNSLGLSTSASNLDNRCLGMVMADSGGNKNTPFNVQIDVTDHMTFQIYYSKAHLESLLGKFIDPQTGELYRCNSFVPAYNTINSQGISIVKSAGYICNASKYSITNHYISDRRIDLYDIPVIASSDTWMKQPNISEGARRFGIWALMHGSIVQVLSHSESEFSLSDWDAMLYQWKKLGIPIVSLREAALYVKNSGLWKLENDVYTMSYSYVDLLAQRRDSELIDAGTGSNASTDFFGNPVPMSSAPDIGCHEFDPNFYYQNPIVITHSKKSIDIGMTIFGMTFVPIRIKRITWKPSGGDAQVTVRDGNGNIVFSGGNGYKSQIIENVVPGITIQQNDLVHGNLIIYLGR